LIVFDTQFFKFKRQWVEEQKENDALKKIKKAIEHFPCLKLGPPKPLAEVEKWERKTAIPLPEGSLSPH